MKNKQVAFELFRYQILPSTREGFQFTLFNEKFSTYDKLVKNKNKILAEILNSKKISFEHSKSKITFRFEIESENIFIFRINVKRELKRNTPDFKEERIEDYPYLFITIDNSPDKQIIAVQENIKAFAKSETVSHLIEKNLSRYLKRYNLAIYVEPIYLEEQFWDLVKQYNNRITSLKFELIRPNMSNISKKISEQLKQLEKTTDAHRLNLELSSGIDGVLKLNKSNNQLKGIVEYASEGGGNASLKIKGYKKRIKTSKGPKEIFLDEMELKDLPPEALAQIFKLLL